ncbi:MAG TPA: HXXEE domain-containing protein [Longimicrobiaceae bacterium]|nr:HXXEE domain-containing protein [Longimicrobiaceae bacterium]
MEPRRTALIGVPLLLTLHNAEEALTIPGALPAIAARVPAQLAAALPTAEQMRVALVVATVVPWLVWLLGRRSRLGLRLLLLLQCVVLVNVAWHVAAAVALGSYAPGLVTALALNLPFSIYLLRRALGEGWMTRRGLFALLAAALLIHGPGAALLVWALSPPG